MQRHTVDPVTNPHYPSSDSAGSEIRPLEAPNRVALLSRVVFNLDFGKFADSGRHFSVNPRSLAIPSRFRHALAAVA
jgi:hypothetical protein